MDPSILGESDDERFDAAQYAFFGGDVSHEVELGGLDEEDDGGLGGGLEDDDERLMGLSEKEEVEDAVSQSDDISVDISEVCSSYMNLHLGITHEPEFDQDALNWFPRHPSQIVQQARGVQTPNHSSQHQWVGTEPGFSQLAFPMVGPYPSARPQVIQSTVHNGPQQAAALHGHVAMNYRSQVPSPPSLPVGGVLPSFLQCGDNPVWNTPAPQGQWLASPSIQLGGSAGLMPGIVQHQMAHPRTSMPPQVLLQRQPGHTRIPPAYEQALYNPLPSAPPLMGRAITHFNAADARDQRNDLQQRGRQALRHYQQVGTESNHLSIRNNSRQQFRSKYMTAEEIESIVRIQLAATHSSDPYIDDYYHQAVQAKIAGGTPHGRRRFAPSYLRDLPSHTRAPATPPAFLPVDGLGRVPFSSIRRPRPLLEVDNGSGPAAMVGGANENLLSSNSSERPLEQEPMLAARIAVEDGLCLLLDVDDIDRFLSVTQAHDGGVQLRRRRQILLEGLAVSLQLVDPTTSSGNSDSSIRERNGQIASKDDLVFRRLVSLPKGRKLVSRYLQRLPPGSHLVQVVCMAVFRHLRFLFGATQKDSQKDSGEAAATSGLANMVANCVDRMDLVMLSGSLEAVVLSPDQPPLRPLGSAYGDEATVLLRRALDRATILLTDPSLSFPFQDRAVWQAAFDNFFLLLYKYCTNKYDSIIHSLMMSTPPGSTAAISSAAAAAMSKEMPVELLRASLPHMNEQQRKSLLDFAQRSMAMGGLGGHIARDSHAYTAAVPG